MRQIRTRSMRTMAPQPSALPQKRKKSTQPIKQQHPSIRTALQQSAHEIDLTADSFDEDSVSSPPRSESSYSSLARHSQHDQPSNQVDNRLVGENHFDSNPPTPRASTNQPSNQSTSQPAIQHIVNQSYAPLYQDTPRTASLRCDEDLTDFNFPNDLSVVQRPGQSLPSSSGQAVDQTAIRTIKRPNRPSPRSHKVLNFSNVVEPTPIITPARKGKKARRKAANDPLTVEERLAKQLKEQSAEDPASSPEKKETMMDIDFPKLCALNTSTWLHADPTPCPPTPHQVHPFDFQIQLLTSYLQVDDSSSSSDSQSSSQSIDQSMDQSNDQSSRECHRMFTFSHVDVLNSCMSFCSLLELLLCGRVSRAFRSSSRSKIAWSNSHLKVDDARWMKALQRMTIQTNLPGQRHPFTGLKHLTLNGNQIEVTDSMFKTLFRPLLPELVELNILNVTELNDVSCKEIALHCTKLRVLTLQSCLTLSTAGWTFIASSPFAHLIQTFDCTKFRAFECLPGLDRFTNLQSLNLRGCRNMPDSALGRLAEASLTSLDLSFTSVSQSGLADIFAAGSQLCSSLLHLSIQGASYLESEGIWECAKAYRLQSINLSSCPLITDTAFLNWEMYGDLHFTIQTIKVDHCRKITGYLLRAIGRQSTAHLGEFESKSVVTDEPETDEKSIDSDDELLERDRREERRQLLVQQSQCQSSSQGMRSIPWSNLRVISVVQCQRVDTASKTALGKARPDIHVIESV